MHTPKNLSLFIGISIPFVMILLVLGSIYIPGLFNKPQYNFIYTTRADYTNPRFTVENSKIKLDCSTIQPLYPGAPLTPCAVDKAGKLYLHDTIANTDTEISYADAQLLTINGSMQSPDGYTVSAGDTSGVIIPFMMGGYGDYGTYYLKGHGSSKKLNLQTNTPDYSYYSFNFLGWKAR